MVTTKTLQLIRHYEGIHDGNLKVIGLQPKLCPADYWTIGYGHVVIDPVTHKPLKGPEGAARALELHPSMTIQQAEELLLEDIQKYALTVIKNLKPGITGERLGALVSLCYNIGIGNFVNSDTLYYTNKYKFEEAADNFKWWRKAGGKILPGLVARRKSEAHLYLTGELKFFKQQKDGTWLSSN